MARPTLRAAMWASSLFDGSIDATRDKGDGGAVAAGFGLGRVGFRGRKHATEGEDNEVIDVAGELQGEVWWLVLSVDAGACCVSYIVCQCYEILCPSDAYSLMSALIRSAVVRTVPCERSSKPACSRAATSAWTRRYWRPSAFASADTEGSGCLCRCRSRR